MSYTTMLRVNKFGVMDSAAQFSNAWGSAMRVWTSLSDKYCGGNLVISMKGEELENFWKLAKSPKLTRAERLTFAMTFDKTIVEVERAKELAGLIREFDKDNPVDPRAVNHLPVIAHELEKHASDDCIGFGFIMTSVSDGGWYLPDVCKNPFHDNEHPEDEECHFCHNQWADRTHSRLFRWDLDKDKGFHSMLFGEFGESQVICDHCNKPMNNWHCVEVQDTTLQPGKRERWCQDCFVNNNYQLIAVKQN